MDMSTSNVAARGSPSVHVPDSEFRESNTKSAVVRSDAARGADWVYQGSEKADDVKRKIETSKTKRRRRDEEGNQDGYYDWIGKPNWKVLMLSR